MPFLRYKTGDAVKLATTKCSCGRHFREVEQIFGRTTNYYILTSEGVKVTAFDHIPRSVNNIIETQIVQDKIDELIINVTTNGKFNEKDKMQIIKNTLEHTSKNMKVIVNEIESIPRGANGKFIAVVNNLINNNLLKENKGLNYE